MKAKEKIAALQALMKKEGIDGYLIPSSDPHMSEYLPDHYAARSWFSGFNGSAGTLAVTSEKAALWADGRYFIQAEHQLEGSGIELMKIGEPAFLLWKNGWLMSFPRKEPWASTALSPAPLLPKS